MVLGVSSRTFVGSILCRDPRWLKVISDYLAEVVAVGNKLRPYPHYLRAILRPFLAPRSRMADILANAMEVLRSPIEEREAFPGQFVDLLGFLVETSVEVKHESIILKLLVLSSAAVSRNYRRMRYDQLIGPKASYVHHGGSQCSFRSLCPPPPC